jgi:ferredoxin-NADP reductase
MAAQEFKCTVKSFKMLTPTVFEVTFDGKLAADGAAPMQFEAGQFVSVVIPGAGPKGRDLRRAYSIASGPEVHPIELCVKLVEGGPGTNYLYKLREGSEFKGYAPYGDFVYRKHSSKNACFIATGTGIAPFRSMVFSKKYLQDPPQKAFCLLGVRTESELIYVDEFKNMPNMKFVPAVSQPEGAWDGFKGRVTDYLRGLGSDFPWLETEFYLCGSGPMITEMKTLLGEKGVQKEHIHVEKYY